MVNPHTTVSIAQAVMMGIEMWVNKGFEPLRDNPLFGPSGEPPPSFANVFLLTFYIKLHNLN